MHLHSHFEKGLNPMDKLPKGSEAIETKEQTQKRLLVRLEQQMETTKNRLCSIDDFPVNKFKRESLIDMIQKLESQIENLQQKSE